MRIRIYNPDMEINYGIPLYGETTGEKISEKSALAETISFKKWHFTTCEDVHFRNVDNWPKLRYF